MRRGVTDNTTYLGRIEKKTLVSSSGGLTTIRELRGKDSHIKRIGNYEKNL